MGGKKKRTPKPVETCPCGHEIAESGLCLVDGPDGQAHEVPSWSNVCECHGLLMWSAPTEEPTP